MNTSTAECVIFRAQCTVQHLLVLFARKERVALRHPHACNDVILNKTTQRRTICRHKILVVGRGNHGGLGAGNLVLREMQVHFITFEIGIVCITVG